MQPKIKICGITCEEDIDIVNEAKVDYVGFVLFFEKSKRYVSLGRAKELKKRLKSSIKSVAVVVSPTIAQVREIEDAKFDVIQIHGDLPEEVMNQIHIPIFRAVNVENELDVKKGTEFSNNKIDCIVLDGKNPGSGETFCWDYVVKNVDNVTKIMLAGGLTSQNVCTAINKVNPYIVDVSSSVEKEQSTGKDKDKVFLFVETVRNNKITQFK